MADPGRGRSHGEEVQSSSCGLECRAEDTQLATYSVPKNVGIEFWVETVLLGCGSSCHRQVLIVFLFDTSSFSVRGLPVGMSPAGEGPGATACSGHSILTCRVNVMADGYELDTGLVSSYQPLKQSVDGDPVIELG